MPVPARASKRAETGGGRRKGVIAKDKGSFGFIDQDDFEEEMFVLPSADFDDRLPPIGTRVTYEVVTDQKTGRPRAEDLQEVPVRRTGVIAKDKGGFGFIDQDGFEEEMFVLPPSCAGFDGKLPPIGTKVTFEVVKDGKTGRPRADDVQAVRRSGTLARDKGGFGFIDQDDFDEEMFVLPPRDGKLPAIGTRATYEVVTDQKTGRPRADDVEFEDPTRSHRSDDQSGRDRRELSRGARDAGSNAGSDPEGDRPDDLRVPYRYK
jgi:cold shock CspA family protein